jgi:hypothetical protein
MTSTSIKIWARRSGEVGGEQTQHKLQHLYLYVAKSAVLRMTIDID